MFHLYPGKVDVCKYAILRPIRLSDIYLSDALTPQFEWCMRNNHRACCWLNSPRIFKINTEMRAVEGTVLAEAGELHSEGEQRRQLPIAP